MIDPAAKPSRPTWLSTIRQFVPRPVAEPCELCSAPLAPKHRHMIEPATRKLLCACDACAILFGNQADARYRSVPRQVERLPDFRLTDLEWESLTIPISMAFFYWSSPAGRVIALYPGPAGATESLLELEAWDALVEANPILRGLEPDVEALLVNRTDGAREYYRVPIDHCYRLVGLIRTSWHGLSGGEEVWREIGAFFAGLQEQSGPVRAQPRA